LVKEAPTTIKNIINKNIRVKIDKDFIELENITAKRIYLSLVASKFRPPTSQKKLQQRMHSELSSIYSPEVYQRIYATTIDTYSRYFQYKILNNILFLNRDLHRFKIHNNPSCPFCSSYPETIDHLFVECIESKNFYFRIRDWLNECDIHLPACNKVNIILGVDDKIIDYIILLYKLCFI